MRTTINNILLSFLAAGALSACTQTTPSMMNTSRVELARETRVEQLKISDITEINVKNIADEYHKYGSGPIDLTMTYDPKSKSFTKTKSGYALGKVKNTLKDNGITNYTAQSLPVPDGKPSLIVSYDAVMAQAPSDCDPMPGLENRETGRFIGDYKFGCGVDKMFAKQIARPSDLEGKSDMGISPARREAVKVEEYSAGVPREPLSGVERGNIAGGS